MSGYACRKCCWVYSTQYSRIETNDDRGKVGRTITGRFGRYGRGRGYWNDDRTCGGTYRSIIRWIKSWSDGWINGRDKSRFMSCWKGSGQI